MEIICLQEEVRALNETEARWNVKMFSKVLLDVSDTVIYLQ